MEQRWLDEAERHPELGPHYFAARETAEKFMAQFEAQHLEPLLKKAAESFHDRMREDLENFLLSDVESNIQGTIWRQIDDSVRALLSGEQWALKRYALAGRYDCEKIRATVAKHIPAELQDARVSDLEAEIDRLRKELEFYRQRH